MAKHTLEIEFDYDFVLIGISSHEKDYRLCWTVNNALNLQLSKQESLEIKGRKQTTPSFFSFFLFEKQDDFIDYAIIANLSESKTVEQTTSTLFDALDESDNEYLIPEQKQMNYFFLIRGEIENEEVNEIIQQIKEIENVQTAVRIDVKSLRSKQNLIF